VNLKKKLESNLIELNLISSLDYAKFLTVMLLRNSINEWLDP
jgi:hypothetical protein